MPKIRAIYDLNAPMPYSPYDVQEASKNRMPFQTFGYFEDIQDCETMQAIGCRNFPGETPNHKLGFEGQREHTFQKGETIFLDKAHKGRVPYTFKRATRCWITTQALCGRMR
jgi:hypothetical protein